MRELIFIYEQYGQEWAERMSRCLIDLKEEVGLVREYSDHLDPEKIEAYEAQYDEILEYCIEHIIRIIDSFSSARSCWDIKYELK